MTDRAQPGAIDSVIRNDEIAEAMSAFSEGAIVSPQNPTNASIRRSDIDETVLDAFSISTSSNSLDVTIAEGEGYVEGWFCRDVTTTLTLPTNATTDIVVGYNTDAIFDPNVDPDRDAADEVIVDLQQNVDPDVPQVVAHRVTTDGGGVTSTERVAPVGSLNIRGLKSPTLTTATDRKRPTAQLQSRSALSTPTNAESVVFQRAPVNDEAVQGTESVLTLLQSGIDPSVVLRRELDGQGGAYSHQFDATLGRFARINVNLSFNFVSFSDVPHYKFRQTGSSGSISLSNNGAKSLTLETDGSGNTDRIAVESTVPLRIDSLGAFRLTFKNVQYSDNDGSNAVSLGFHTAPLSNVDSTGSPGFLFDSRGDAFFDTNNGTEFLADVVPNGENISLEYDGNENEVRGLINGELGPQTVSFSSKGDFVPFIQLRDNNNNTNSESVSVDQITVEPIGGAF
jgi:hypothetical protein